MNKHKSGSRSLPLLAKTCASEGGGIQPEILKTQPDYFKTNMYWILGSENHEGYWVVSNEVIAKYVSGGVIGDKYNNIQNRIFKDIPAIDRLQLIVLLKNWLKCKD